MMSTHYRGRFWYLWSSVTTRVIDLFCATLGWKQLHGKGKVVMEIQAMSCNIYFLSLLCMISPLDHENDDAFKRTVMMIMMNGLCKRQNLLLCWVFWTFSEQFLNIRHEHQLNSDKGICHVPVLGKNPMTKCPVPNSKALSFNC